MDFMQFIDVILHVDKSLGFLIKEYGTLIYMVLFLIVFCETGLVVFPFLPGDTLLFIGGAFCAMGEMNIWLLMGLLIIAATTGNTLNYWIGSKIGEKVYSHDYRWLDQKALQRTHAFYEHHGGKTIILSRFVPIVRTFAPFVAGVSKMTFSKFQFFNITGALLWVVGLVSAGYFFGNMPIIRDHLNTIVLLGVGAAAIPVVLGAIWKLYQKLKGQQA
ncbi:VTT domain-containing protein [Glaciimonas sp. Gout2]|uniref:VTT domain-containing protein n=2 Tax=Glaciimonas TaxID=1229970 RepID=UPI002AB50E19|nr:MULTISPECIES: VTT domain-containing protein [unclassified Glaciimonas]MDY7545027.1 VTT domain-containing protein [Glaciimonas sp. CA11.2]MEB0011456.1 VTT domain-containing protein [Glaciimonas sp. Cout2]MEB0081107.1 VTT domain-containing protein [Glaciimonas sp. Gout2]